LAGSALQLGHLAPVVLTAMDGLPLVLTRFFEPRAFQQLPRAPRAPSVIHAIDERLIGSRLSGGFVVGFDAE
jgi:hypothetical protein